MQPIAPRGFGPYRCQSACRLAPASPAERSDRRGHFLRSGMVDHVAAPRDAMKGAGAELLVQARGMRVGIDDAIVRPGNEAHGNDQLFLFQQLDKAMVASNEHDIMLTGQPFHLREDITLYLHADGVVDLTQVTLLVVDIIIADIED